MFDHRNDAVHGFEQSLYDQLQSRDAGGIDYTFTTFVNGQLTVTAATPTLTILCPGVTYDGTAHGCAGVAVGVDGVTQVAGETDVQPGERNKRRQLPGDGHVQQPDGNYSLNASDDTATATLIIDKATSSVTLTCPPSVAYTGAAQTPCTATYSGAGGLSGTPTITYSNNTNPGTATASASYAGDSNHTASSNTVNFAISGAPVSATAGSYSGTYDGATHSPSACVVSGTYTDSLTCSNNPSPVGPDVSSGTVTPVVSGDTTNFTVIPVNGAWNITQASSTVSMSCPSSVVYNGAAQTPCTVTVTGVGGLSTTVPITYTNNVNFGTANASATFPGDTDHAGGNASVNFAIIPAAVTATAGGGTWVYNGSKESPAACVVSGNYTGSLTCTNNPATVGPDVGSGTNAILPVVTGDTLTNYQITDVDGSWSITPASTTVTVSLSVECHLQRRSAGTLHGDGDGHGPEPGADAKLHE